MTTHELHKAQASILKTLRHSQSARYTFLMQPTGLESDVFKFHLRKLVNSKLVQKNEEGCYCLTPRGKEFANNLSKQKPIVQKQPKLSVAIIAKRRGQNKSEYLFQKRLRNPHFEFWGCLSGPVQWGEPIEQTAKYEFEKQTGLQATYQVKSFYRLSDYGQTSNELLEDKLFAVVEAQNVKGEIANSWHGGFNAWMTLKELQTQEKYFKHQAELVEMVETGKKYSTGKAFYNYTEY
jgi:predicted transcriptional regulator/ADP-ribose pyrophosphatase YjhB (NUDIX family)